MIILLVVLLAGLVHAASIYWFRHEIQTQAVDLARKQAEETAAVLSRALPNETLALDQRQPERQLDQLVKRNSEIVAVLVVNADGSLAAVRVEESGKFPELARQIASMNPARLNERTIIDLIQQRYPQLEPERVMIRRGGQTVGWLRFFVDRALTYTAVNSAAAKMTANLVFVVIGLTIALLIGMLFLRRQQRLATHLRSQRDQAAQLAYVGTLAAGLAHEIRNPINALSMQLDMLEEDVAENQPGAVGPRLDRIRGGLGALEHTVRDFLTFASPDKQRPTRVELGPMLADFCAEIRQRNEGVRLECEPPRDLAQWCDVHGLRQILGNLVSNAILAQAGRPDCAVAIEAQRQGKSVRIHVDDAGGGVPEDARARLFEAFFTTRPEGTGLGLPIARRLAEMNGGSLDLSDSPSPLGGARFTLTLPADTTT
ncbi:HAMP domain-containing histidine kinase [bacterium]|nr:HAMP domain-containing histidine kinase [bacterium]